MMVYCIHCIHCIHCIQRFHTLAPYLRIYIYIAGRGRVGGRGAGQRKYQLFLDRSAKKSTFFGPVSDKITFFGSVSEKISFFWTGQRKNQLFLDRSTKKSPFFGPVNEKITFFWAGNCRRLSASLKSLLAHNQTQRP